MTSRSLAVFRWTALFCFIAVAILQLLTFLPINLERLEPLFGLATVIGFLLSLFAVISLMSLTRNGDHSQLFALVDKIHILSKVLLSLLLAYMLFNWIFVLPVLNHGGTPVYEHGTHALMDHSRIIQVLTAEEYEQALSNSLRIISSPGLLLCAGALVIFSAQAKLQSN